MTREETKERKKGKKRGKEGYEQVARQEERTSCT